MEKKNVIFVVSIIVIIVLLLVINILVSDKKEKNDMKDLLIGKHYVEMKVKNYGTITLELDADTAPITVTNFINLVNSKFYDGLTFHRIIDGFMIQGGDPNGNGTGGSSKKIKGEFSANGITNNIHHERGVISMARNSYSYDSASSQFFIMHADNSELDGLYAAFGKVISGMNVVDKIAKVKVEDDNGTVKSDNQPVIESIRVITDFE